MKRIKKLCSKSNLGRSIDYVKVSGEFMEATDSFRWAKIKNKGYVDGYHHPKTGEVVQDQEYPDTNLLVERAKSDAKFTFKVNRKYLIEVLEVLGKGNTIDKIEIHLSDTNKPIYFTNENGEALLMPLI